jgi:hypothetical protein
MVETFEEQERLWVEGKSVHVRMSAKYKAMTGDEYQCCPDFSCCEPQLLAPVGVRKAYAAASRKGKDKFLGHFLGALVKKQAPDERVYITDGTHEDPS